MRTKYEAHSDCHSERSEAKSKDPVVNLKLRCGVPKSRRKTSSNATGSSIVLGMTFRSNDSHA